MTGERNVLTLDHLVAGLAEDQRTRGLVSARPITNAVIDSRKAQLGSLFIALKGERRDGHEFIADAVGKGAVAVIAERSPDPDAEQVQVAPDLQMQSCGDVAYLIVHDSLTALQRAAAYWRRRHSARVVGVTGSVGKTTTKEAIDAVLRQRYRTLKSEGNYNNEIGLPLTLLHLNGSHEYVVLEMGMYALREIAHLATIALPHVGVVTNVGPVHLERLGTVRRIAEAKAELPQALPTEADGGIAILNSDDTEVAKMAEQTHARVITYGLEPGSTVWADRIESLGLEGISFTMHCSFGVMHIRVPTLGRHSIHTALAGAAVGLSEGLSLPEIAAGLQDQPHQLRLVAVTGPAGSTILDDTYNASPASSLAALNLLGELDGRKIAILGDMYELGDFEVPGHQLVGRRARDVTDILIAVGQLGRLIADSARDAGMRADCVYSVDDNAEAIGVALDVVDEGDIVLVKGSRGLKMEEIVSALTQPPRIGGMKQR